MRQFNLLLEGFLNKGEVKLIGKCYKEPEENFNMFFSGYGNTAQNLTFLKCGESFKDK